MIRCYAGLLGSGKSYTMVADAVTWLRKNHGMVYTNMAGLRFPEAVFFSGLTDVMHLRSGLLLLDEASVAMSSRFWQSVPRELLTRFAQLRKHGLDMWYTAQDEARVDTVLREITNEFVRVRKFMRTHTAKMLDIPGDPTTKNRPRSLGLPQRLDPLIFDMYDTMEVIKTDGSSAGQATTDIPLSVVAARRAATTERVSGPLTQTPRLMITDVRGELRLTQEASHALTWLKKEGHFSARLPAKIQVEQEVLRRRWLAAFGMTCHDVPYTCTRANPWLVGHDPQTVEERKRLRDIEEAGDVIASKTRGRSTAGIIKNAA